MIFHTDRGAVLALFREAMARRGLKVDEIIADGKLHQCDTDGPHGKGDGAYILSMDGFPAGGFQNWRDGEGWTDWRFDIGRPLSVAEEVEREVGLSNAKRQHDLDAQARQEKCRQRSAELWAKGREADPGHPYLTQKSAKAFGIRQHGKQLLIPVRDEAGRLFGLQMIDPAGRTLFLTGTAKSGRFHLLGQVAGGRPLCVVEGYATGAIIHEATGWAVAVAFDAGNLLPVAKVLARRYSTSIVVAGDNDATRSSNPGLTAARRAAGAVSGRLVTPTFAHGDGGTDWNDFSVRYGLDAVRASFRAARGVG